MECALSQNSGNKPVIAGGLGTNGCKLAKCADQDKSLYVSSVT